MLLAVAAFASAATTRICDGLLPQLASEFRVTPGEAAIVATAYSLTYGLLQPGFGIAGDRYGKYRLILICCVMSLVTTAACAVAPTLNMLALARLAAHGPRGRGGHSTVRRRASVAVLAPVCHR